MIPVDISNRSEEEQKRIRREWKKLKQQNYTGQYELKNKQRELFCQEYIIDLSGGAAAERAGYSAKTKYRQASRLLGNTKVLMRIKYLMNERKKRLEVSQDSVINELSALAFSNMFDVVEVIDGKIILKDPYRDKDGSVYDAGKAVSAVSTTGDFTSVKMWDKISALDKLMKHMGISDPKSLQIQLRKLELMEEAQESFSELEIEDDGFIAAMNSHAMEEIDELIEIETGEEEEEEENE